MPSKSDNIHDLNVYNIFQQIGCSENEIKTFQALLRESGGATVLELQKKLNIPRASIYDRLEELSRKGLVRKGKKENGSVFFAESTDTLLSVFKERSERVLAAGHELETYLSNLPDMPTYTPKFTVFEDAGAAEHIFRDILRSREKLSYWFWPTKEMLRTVPDEVFRTFVRERIEKGMYVQILWPKKHQVVLDEYPVLGPNSRERQLREIRVLQEPIDTTMAYAIYGNKVAYISSCREHYGFIIDSEELSRMMKSQFQYLWRLARRYKQS